METKHSTMTTKATRSTITSTSNEMQENDHDEKKILFVTVGTTLFAKLIDSVMHPITLNILIEQYRYSYFIIQYGKGTKPTIPIEYRNNDSVQFELYDFKSSLHDDMVKAHMIICHAGAGTLTEAIRISQQSQQLSPMTANNTTSITTNKTIIVTVINNLLMDNHQVELAYALQRRQLVYVIDDPNDLTTSHEGGKKIWERIDSFHNSSSIGTGTSATTNIFQSNPYHVPLLLQKFFLSQQHAQEQQPEHNQAKQYKHENKAK